MINNKIVFLFIGRILWDKGYAELITAAKKVNKTNYNCEFQVIGSFDHQPSAVKKNIVYKDHSDKVINYLGYKTDIKKYLKEADCIVLPTYHEGMSRVLMEAASMSKPIITTDIFGCKELVKNNVNGYLIKPKDADELYIAFIKFLKLDKKERHQMSLESRKIAVTNFDVKKIILAYQNIISDI